MEKTNCLLCDSNQTETIFQSRDFRLNNHKDTFTFVQCQHCNLIFQDPLPSEEEMINHYNQNTLYKNPAKLSGIKKHLHNFGLKKRSKIITQFIKQGTLLDIGCGNGSFLKYMVQKTQFKVMGTEINEQNVALIKKGNVFSVHLGDLQQIAFPEKSFDVITLWDVIEHLPDPKSLLSEISKIIKSNGYLIIRVPNGDSFDFKIFRKYWAGVDAPRHYLIYTQKTLSDFLNNAGFSIISTNNKIGSYFNFLTSLDFWLKDTKVKPEAAAAIIKFLSNPIVRGLLFPIFWIKDLVSSGTSLTIVAKLSTSKSINDK